MSDYEMVKQLYEWGIDIKPYVGLMITQAEADQIIGGESSVEAN